MSRLYSQAGNELHTPSRKLTLYRLHSDLSILACARTRHDTICEKCIVTDKRMRVDGKMCAYSSVKPVLLHHAELSTHPYQ